VEGQLRRINRMLLKSHSLNYSEDFGLLAPDGQTVTLYEAGSVPNIKKNHFSHVARVNALWVERDVKIRCALADTPEKKKIGLQRHKALDEDCGLYFPYEPFTDVTFHQGSVPFSLDLIFLCDGQIIQLEENTRVGHDDRWSCEECDGVIEVSGGWCLNNDVAIGERVLLSAVSKRDLKELEEEKEADISLVAALADMI